MDAPDQPSAGTKRWKSRGPMSMYPEHEDYNTLYTPEQRKRFHDMQMRANGATIAARKLSAISPHRAMKIGLTFAV